MLRTRAIASVSLVVVGLGAAASPLAAAAPVAGSDEPAACTVAPSADSAAPMPPDAVATTTAEAATVASPDEAANPLVGAWCVVSVGASAVGDVVATVEFTAAGEVFGLGGVNRFRGTYAVDGDDVEFGPIVQTAMAGPEPAMAVEAALLGALRDSRPFDVDGTVLTIGAGDDAVVLHAAVEPVPAGAAIVVSGTVTYLQRIALVDGATLIVRVSDVSIADAAAPVVAEATITPMTQVPIPYAIAVPVALLEPGHRYSLSARIVHDDELLFVSTESLPVVPDATTQTIDVVVSPA